MKKDIIIKRGSVSDQEAMRLKVVSYLKKGLGTQKQAAEIFEMNERTVRRIWSKYKEGGLRKLKNRKRGVEGGKKITGVQAAEIRRLIKDKMPDQLKLSFGLWTREAVQKLILNKYNIELSRWQVGRYLKSWGYTSQKPIRKAFEQKPEEVKQWLEKEFPRLKRRASKENAVIYFGDETGMRSDHQAGKTYAPKGKTPVIRATGKRFSLNMISAISNRGHLQFMILDGRFNGEIFQTFLQRMIKYTKHKIFFVTDGHPAHKTLKLKDWLEKNKQKIEVFYLPPYSPELNPQEYVNQDVKTNIVGKHRPINKDQMRANVEGFMNKRKSNKKQVQKYFHVSHVQYAA